MHRVEYELTEDDAVDFSVSALRASPNYAKLLNLVLILGCVLFGALALLMLRLGASRWMAWAFLSGIPLVIFIVPPLTWRRMPNVFRRQFRTGTNRALLGPQTLELTPEGVHRVHSQSEAKVAWSAIEKLTASPTQLAIYISTQQAFVLPRRAFANAADETAFRAEAERLSGKQFQQLDR